MRKSTKYNFPIIIIVLFCCLFAFVYLVWRGIEKNAYLSCVASIGSEIQKLNDTKNLAANNKDWKILSETEVGFLMSQIHGYDCAGVENQTLDLWSYKINIALRNSSGRIAVIVWSNGADEISGTEDDLVAPYGGKVPQ